MRRLCLNAASIVNAMPAPFFVHGAAQMTLNADRRRKRETGILAVR